MRQLLINAIFATSNAEAMLQSFNPLLHADALADVVEAFTALEPSDWELTPSDYESALWVAVEEAWYIRLKEGDTPATRRAMVRNALVSLGLGPYLRPLEVSA